MNAPINIDLIRATADAIRAALGEDDDAQAFLDTLDGETDAISALDRLIEADQDAKAHAEAIKARIGDMRNRLTRAERRSQAAREGICALLDAMGERKVTRPLATVSRLAGRVSCQITDEDAVPTQLCEVKRVVDKAAVKAALEAGEVVPGAELVKGADSVSVRSK